MPEALARIAETILADPETAAHASIVDLAERSGHLDGDRDPVQPHARLQGLRQPAGRDRHRDRPRRAGPLGDRHQRRHRARRPARRRARRDHRRRHPGDPGHRGRPGRRARSSGSRRRSPPPAGSRSSGWAAAAPPAGRWRSGSSASGSRSGTASDTHTALTNAALLGARRRRDRAVALRPHPRGDRDPRRGRRPRRADRGGDVASAARRWPRSPTWSFTTSVHETTFRLAALSALHSQLLVLDLIYVAVAQRTYERTAEALELTRARRGRAPGARDDHRQPQATHERDKPL